MRNVATHTIFMAVCLYMYQRMGGTLAVFMALCASYIHVLLSELRQIFVLEEPLIARWP